MTPIQTVVSRLKGTRKGDGWMAQCPAHEDRKASLSIGVGRDDRVLLNCHAGCELNDIVSAAGLELGDLFPEETKKNGKPTPNKTQHFDYLGADGKPYMRVTKAPGKKFMQSRREGNKWEYGLKGLETIPYQLPDVIKAASAGDTIVIVEGEKDVAFARHIGLTATTNPAGAGKWKDHHSRYLAGAHVIIVPDEDAPGIKHADQVFKSVSPHAESVRIVRLADLTGRKLPKGYDLADWVQEGGKKEALLEAPPAASEEVPSYTDQRLNDTGNSNRLIEEMEGEFVYIPTWRKWMHYDGTHWTEDTRGALIERATDSAERLAASAASMADEGMKRKTLAFASKSLNMAGLEAAIKRSRGSQSIDTADLDADAELFGVQNGTIVLTKGQIGFREHRKEDLITQLAGVKYDKDAKCPLWHEFLGVTFGESQELLSYIKRLMGYTLLGHNGEQVMIVFHGAGANGKSVFLDTIAKVFGDYHKTIRAEALLMDHRGGASIPSDVARLKSARFVTSSEAEIERRMAEGLIKSITGDSMIMARLMYSDWFEFRPQFVPFLATNHRPVIKGTDEGIWRRMKLVSFNRTVHPRDRIPYLDKKLFDANGSGILNWLLEGLQEYYEQGLNEPAIIQADTAQYRDEMDPVALFISECDVGEGHYCDSGTLYKGYTDFCKEQGMDHPMNKMRFGRTLGDRGYTRSKSNGRVIWKGIDVPTAPLLAGAPF